MKLALFLLYITAFAPSAFALTVHPQGVSQGDTHYYRLLTKGYGKARATEHSLHLAAFGGGRSEAEALLIGLYGGVGALLSNSALDGLWDKGLLTSWIFVRRSQVLERVGRVRDSVLNYAPDYKKRYDPHLSAKTEMMGFLALSVTDRAGRFYSGFVVEFGTLSPPHPVSLPASGLSLALALLLIWGWARATRGRAPQAWDRGPAVSHHRRRVSPV